VIQAVMGLVLAKSNDEKLCEKPAALLDVAMIDHCLKVVLLIVHF
jgi:hypothetical protein